MKPKRPNRSPVDMQERGPQQGRLITLKPGVRGIALPDQAYFDLQSPHPKRFYRQGETKEPLVEGELAFAERRREDSPGAARKKPVPKPAPPEQGNTVETLIEQLRAKQWDEKRIKSYLEQRGYTYNPDLVHALHKPNRIRRQLRMQPGRGPRARKR
ncbi:MAG: hypothetical protein Q7R47_03690 [Candidatus Diapherotrites archaeon]|nr:hypothetical protein [Candidatus Diapherotrites archaeon]